MSRIKTLRILSYNIHKGFSAGNRSFVLSNIKQAIRLVHADLVFLQEVIGAHEGHAREVDGWPNSSQFEFLADEIWPHFAYGKNAIHTEGHHGNAILSKFPFVSWENVDISTNRFERRGLLHGVIEVPGHKTPIHGLCVHFDLLQRGRDVQLSRLVERISQKLAPQDALLIAGDFNDWRNRASSCMDKNLNCHELFETLHGARARTFPSLLPVLHLDRIYFRGLKPSSAEVLRGTPWRDLSDHAALFGEFTLPD